MLPIIQNQQLNTIKILCLLRMGILHTILMKNQSELNLSGAYLSVIEVSDYGSLDLTDSRHNLTEGLQTLILFLLSNEVAHYAEKSTTRYTVIR